MAAKGSRSGWEIEDLAAEGPFPEFREKLSLFGQFVGDWDILEARYPKADGSETRARGEIHVRWILEGRGVQDTFSTIEEETGKVVPAGTTIRFYDPGLDAWHCVWISPQQRVVQLFIAKGVGKEIVLEGRTPDGKSPEKWTFSDITSDEFRWRSEESHDGGKTWVLTEEMKVRRRLCGPAGSSQSR